MLGQQNTQYNILKQIKYWNYYPHLKIKLHLWLHWLTLVEEFNKEPFRLPVLHLKFKCWSERGSASQLPKSCTTDLSTFAGIFWKAVQVIPMKLDGLIIKASRAILWDTCQNILRSRDIANSLRLITYNYMCIVYLLYIVYKDCVCICFHT